MRLSELECAVELHNSKAGRRTRIFKGHDGRSALGLWEQVTARRHGGMAAEGQAGREATVQGTHINRPASRSRTTTDGFDMMWS